jgi:hypothetical protein
MTISTNCLSTIHHSKLIRFMQFVFQIFAQTELEYMPLYEIPSTYCCIRTLESNIGNWSVFSHCYSICYIIHAFNSTCTGVVLCLFASPIFVCPPHKNPGLSWLWLYGSWIYSYMRLTKPVSSNPTHGAVYSIQLYVMKLVSDLWQVGGFLCVLRFCQLIKLTTTI